MLSKCGRQAEVPSRAGRKQGAGGRVRLRVSESDGDSSMSTVQTTIIIVIIFSAGWQKVHEGWQFVVVDSQASEYKSSDSPCLTVGAIVEVDVQGSGPGPSSVLALPGLTSQNHKINQTLQELLFVDGHTTYPLHILRESRDFVLP